MSANIDTVMLCRVCGNQSEPHHSGMCDSCETQDAYEKASEEGLPNLVANVICDDGAGLFGGFDEERRGRLEGGYLWYSDPLPVHDPDDPSDGELYIAYCAEDGDAACVWAPKCDGVEELERRIARCFGPDCTIDDWQHEALSEKSEERVAVTPAAAAVSLKRFDPVEFHEAYGDEADPKSVTALTAAWFDRIRAGDSEAIEEAIGLIRVHALPEGHPLALD